MFSFLLSVALLGVSAVHPAPSLTVESDRKSILDELRGPVQARLGSPVEFVVTTFLKDNDWVFIQAEPRRPGGKSIDGQRYNGADWDNMDGLTTTAILRKTKGSWKILELRVGATDAWYCGFVSTRQFDPCGGYPAND
jgi:hypothetical protein